MLRLLFLAVTLWISASKQCVGNDLKERDLKQAAMLAVFDSERAKPMDTFAQESLLFLTGKPTWKTSDKNWMPLDFVLSCLFQERDWANEKLLSVPKYAFRKEVGLAPNEPERNQFSLVELVGNDKLLELMKSGQDKRAQDQSAKLDAMEKEAQVIASRIMLMNSILSGQFLKIVPPDKPITENENFPWVVPSMHLTYYTPEQFEPIDAQLMELRNAYITKEASQFARAGAILRESLRRLSPSIYPSEKQLRREYLYNHLNGLYYSTIFFILATVCVGGLFLFKRNDRFSWLRVTALASAVTGIALQAVNITIRCLIAERPPVTNMFESVIWVSLVVAILGIIFYAIYRSDLYLLAAMPVSAISVLLMLQLPGPMPSNVNPLSPVLRDNFWLTVHVLTIVMGYAAFALATAFGHIVLAMYMAKPEVTRDNLPVHFWLYRVIQLGVLLLGAGTILGGVWANYSWGRFWGWDPKETWALIALLSYIVALHGRIAGWWGHFGMAVASLICFQSIVMAWYGVNFVLGTGLHSYGFGEGGEPYVITLVAFDIGFVVVACLRHLSARPVEKIQKASFVDTEGRVRWL